MKKIFALLTLIVAFAFVTTNAIAAKPEKAQGPHEKTTGELLLRRAIRMKRGIILQ